MELLPLRLQSTAQSRSGQVMCDVTMGLLLQELRLKGKVPSQKILPFLASSLEEATYGRTSSRHVMLRARGTR